jgi:hypothetical protein
MAVAAAAAAVAMHCWRQLQQAQRLVQLQLLLMP